MDLWTKEQMQDATIDELVAYLLEVRKKTEEFKLTFEEISKSLYFNSEITFEDIQEYFEKDAEDIGFKYPLGDERKIYGGEFLNYRKVPLKGYFWVLNTEKIQRPLGMVDIVFTVSKIDIKLSDRRYQNFRTVIRDEKKFVYDYESEKYKQAPTKEKKEDQGNVGLRQFYKDRQVLVDVINYRMQEEYDGYLKALESMTQDIFKYKDKTIRGFLGYFNTLIDWFVGHLKYLDIAFLYDHVDEEQYNHLNDYIGDCIRDLASLIQALQRVEAQHNGQVLNFVEYIRNPLHDPEIKEVYDDANKLLERIQKLFEERDYEAMKGLSKSPEECDRGYYDFDDERLYFNLVEMQTRRFYQKHAGSWDAKMQEEKHLLAYLKEKRAKV
ncbi:hypothetical protein NXB04_20880 [Bacillus paranthracis]|uniref:hypothetical protein n=1 Tax=Bacillus paranthracis TaxID=2026186 RepID=UPI002151E31B|nr:hypothetical protein [Bacillus paranthracis]MCR6465162.1 hypothetical protein [Bacillus paranthracis]MCR9021612.1 hypothetical protein [Bacillus paranthracis]